MLTELRSQVVLNVLCSNRFCSVFYYWPQMLLCSLCCKLQCSGPFSPEYFGAFTTGEGNVQHSKIPLGGEYCTFQDPQ